jgi:hypothetical protein
MPTVCPNRRENNNVNRRDFVKIAAGCFAAAVFSPENAAGFMYPLSEAEKKNAPAEDMCHLEDGAKLYNSDYFKKIKNFNHSYRDDFQADKEEFALIKSCSSKFGRLQRYAGHGNFNILNFDEALVIMDSDNEVPRFTKAELDYIETLFHRDASMYGFYGERIFRNLTDRVPENNLEKMSGTGHFVYSGKSLEIYKKITADLKNLTLTSGVRSVVKQAHLFLSKAVGTKGNLSMASRSIAPVGYSYHGIGDFDVGIKGWGFANFTDKFATTKEYSFLLESGYMRIRYDRKNPYGVRFEPWHVKVI